MIWVDRKNRKIGFADDNYCQVFEMDEIESLVIQNILPAKGGGSAYLGILLIDRKESYAILTGAQNEFDEYKDRISNLTNKQVKFTPEYHNCYNPNSHHGKCIRSISGPL